MFLLILVHLRKMLNHLFKWKLIKILNWRSIGRVHINLWFLLKNLLIGLNQNLRHILILAKTRSNKNKCRKFHISIQVHLLTTFHLKLRVIRKEYLQMSTIEVDKKIWENLQLIDRSHLIKKYNIVKSNWMSLALIFNFLMWSCIVLLNRTFSQWKYQRIFSRLLQKEHKLEMVELYLILHQKNLKVHMSDLEIPE